MSDAPKLKRPNEDKTENPAFGIGAYNADKGRKVSRVHEELHAILTYVDDLGDVMGLVGVVETPGYRMQNIEGWECIQDRSNESRANHTLYVNKALFKVVNVFYNDRKRRWHRVEGPGMHPPRTHLVAILEHKATGRRVRAIVPHAPQVAKGTKIPRADWVASLVLTAYPLWERRAVRKGKRDPMLTLMFGDWNGLARAVAAPLRAKVFGHKRTDVLVVRGTGFKVWNVTYKHVINKVKMLSNHKDALMTKMRITK